MKNDFRRLIWTLGFAGFVSAADNYFVSPSLTAIAGTFGVTVAAAGIILTTYMIPYGCMQPVYGFLGDRASKLKVLRIITLGLAIGTAGSALSPNLFVLCILRVITGFFAAGIIAVSLSFIGDEVPADQKQVYVGKFMGIVFTGQGLSTGLGGILTRYVSWRGAFVFFACAAVAACILLCSYPMPKKPSTAPGTSFFPQCKTVITSPLGRVILPTALIGGFLLLGIYGYLGAFLNERTHLDYMQAGIVTMFYGFSCLAAGNVIGRISAKIGEKRVIMCGAALGAVSALLLLISYRFSSWPVALAATVVLGFAYIFIQSTLASLAFFVAPGCNGISSGLIGFGLFVGGGIGSKVSGTILNFHGYALIWGAYGICLIIFIFVISRLNYDKRQVASKQA